MARKPDPFVKAAAERGDAEAITRWDWATLQSTHAVDRLVKAWGLEPDAARRVVQLERHRRPRER